jgi:hypothetical protein
MAKISVGCAAAAFLLGAAGGPAGAGQPGVQGCFGEFMSESTREINEFYGGAAHDGNDDFLPGAWARPDNPVYPSISDFARTVDGFSGLEDRAGLGDEVQRIQAGDWWTGTCQPS